MDSYRLNKLRFICQHPLRYKNLQKLKRNTSQYSVAPYYQTRSIFVHIPKAAGVSVSSSLYGSYGGGHCSISDYRYIFDRDEFEQFFKFTFVRNPWDRLWSAYRFLQKGGFSERDALWFRENIAVYPDFEAFVLEWLSETNIRKYPHFIPQYEYIVLPEASEPALDFIAYYENLAEDFSSIASRLGLNVALAYENKTGSGEGLRYTDGYNEAMIEKVAHIYHKDISLLGYDFANASLSQKINKRSRGSLD